MNGWIKLYKKIVENNIWRKDLVGWHVFETLMSICDENGKWEGGRFQLSQIANLKDMTTYKALKRLEKVKMVTLNSNNKFTSILICKWKQYQSNGNSAGNNKVTTKEQQSNTLIRIKNKNINKDTVYNPKKLTTDKGNTSLLRNEGQSPEFGNKEINIIIGKFKNLYQTPMPRLKLNRFSAKRLIDKYGVERVSKLVEMAYRCQGQQYAPTIKNIMDLEEKLVSLFNFYTKKNKPKRRIYDATNR